MITNKGVCCTKQLMVHMITGDMDKECTLKQDLEKSFRKRRKVFKGLVMSEGCDINKAKYPITAAKNKVDCRL